jgi:hypothetical protein
MLPKVIVKRGNEVFGQLIPAAFRPAGRVARLTWPPQMGWPLLYPLLIQSCQVRSFSFFSAADSDELMPKSLRARRLYGSARHRIP